MVLIFCDGIYFKLTAAVVFTVASLTDLYDGYYARKHNLITNFGTLMDPIADKFLILAAFFVFMQLHLIALWMFVVILARECLITFWRLLAMRQGKVMAAETAGKVKTTLQMTVIFLILLYLILTELHFFTQSHHVFFLSISWMMLLVVIVTISSGLSFLWHNKQYLHV